MRVLVVISGILTLTIFNASGIKAEVLHFPSELGNVLKISESESQNVLKLLVKKLESQSTNNIPKLREFRQEEEDDDDDEPRPRPINAFPGVANIIFGTLTGDVRRIIEDGAFSFLPKDVRQRVLLIYHNLIGKTTQAPTTTTKTTKKPRRKRTTTTENPTKKEIGVATTPKTSSNMSKDKLIQTPSKQPQSVTTSRPRNQIGTTTLSPAEEDELVVRFEKALLPYLPANPQDAVITELPILV